MVQTLRFFRLFLGLLLVLQSAPFPLRQVQAAAADTEATVYRLSQTTAAYTFWTTPPSERVFKDSPVPTSSGSEVKVYAARNEFEMD